MNSLIIISLIIGCCAILFNLIGWLDSGRTIGTIMVVIVGLGLKMDWVNKITLKINLAPIEAIQQYNERFLAR